MFITPRCSPLSFSIELFIRWMLAVGRIEMLSAETLRIPAALLEAGEKKSRSYLLRLKTACLLLLSKEGGGKVVSER